MTFSRRHLPRALKSAWAGVFCFALGYTAVDAAPAVSDEFQAYATATPAELDAMRGGFSLASGSGELQISIGVDRAVFVDGNLKISSHFNLPANASRITSGPELAALNIIQNGAGNYFTPSNPADLTSAITTVIQNSLDNQTISNLNIINASVTSLSLMRSMAFATSLKEMIAGSVR